MLRIVPRAACYFRLEIINSSGSDVSHLAQSEVDLQKKRSPPLNYVHAVATSTVSRGGVDPLKK